MAKWLPQLLMVALVLGFWVAPGAEVQAQETSASGEVEIEIEEDRPVVSLSLREVLTSALEKNLDIAIQRYNPQISETGIDSQESLFEPSVELAGHTDESTSPQSSVLGGGLVVTNKNRYFAATYLDTFKLGSSVRINAFTNRSATDDIFATFTPAFFTQIEATYTQPFLRNFGFDVNETGIVIAQNNYTISKSRFRQLVMDTLAAAESAYWNLNFTLMDLRATKAALKQAQDFLEQTRVKVRVGTLPPIEITQAEAGVADREENVIITRHAIRTAEDNLRQFMNVPSDSPAWGQAIRPSDQPLVLDKLVNLEEAIQTAMENRPDLEQARLDLGSKQADVNYRRNQRLVRLDFVGSLSYSGLSGDLYSVDFGTGTRTPLDSTPIGESVDQVVDRDFDSWSAEVQVGIPLGNRGAEAAYASAKYEQDQAELEIRRLEQQAVVEVRNAVRAIERDLQRVRAAEVNTRLQREKLEAEQKKYENGMSTAFQILEFQTDLTTAERRRNLAIVGYNQSLVELDRVLGILLDTRDVTIAD